MLAFDNKEAFFAIVTQLENEIDLYDATGVVENDDDESYDRDYPTLDAFEASLGFTSLRQGIEARYNQMKDENLYIIDIGFEDDEIITTFLNPWGEYRIGNSIYVFRGKSTVLEIIDADKRTLDILRNRVDYNNIHLANVIVHDLKQFGTTAQLLTDDSGNQQTPIYNQQPFDSQQTNLVAPRQPSESPANGSRAAWNCLITGVNVHQVLSFSRRADIEVTITNMPWAIPPNYSYPGPTYIQWDIYAIDQNGTLTFISTQTTSAFPPCDGCTFIVTNTFDLTKEGSYRVEVTAWNNYCKTDKVGENFYISDRSGCCEWWDFSGKSKIYSNTRAIRAELTIRNYPGFARIKAKSTIHKVSNGNILHKKKKADKLAIGMGGVHYRLACLREPVTFKRGPKEKTTAKRISVRKVTIRPMTVRRLPGNACAEVTSVHQVWDGSAYADLKLWIPLCGEPEECSPGS